MPVRDSSGGFHNYGYLFGGPYNQDCSILGSIFPLSPIDPTLNPKPQTTTCRGNISDVMKPKCADAALRIVRV